MSETINVNYRLPPELIQRLKLKAVREGYRNYSAAVREALEQWLESKTEGDDTDGQ